MGTVVFLIRYIGIGPHISDGRLVRIGGRGKIIEFAAQLGPAGAGPLLDVNVIVFLPAEIYLGGRAVDKGRIG